MKEISKHKQFWFMVGILICSILVMSTMYKLVRFKTTTHSNNTYSITHLTITKHIDVALESVKNPGQPDDCNLIVESREGFTKLKVGCN
jgi:hypothetical protein